MLVASAERGAIDLGPARSEVENSRQTAGFEAIAGVSTESRVLEHQVSGQVVAHEENGAAALIGMVVLDQRVDDGECEGVAVVVDRPAASAARCSALRWVGSVAYGIVVTEEAVDHGERDPDAAEAASVRADVALARGTAERAVGDMHRKVVVLAENTDCGAANVGASGFASVSGKDRVHDLQPSPSDEDGTTSASLGRLADGVAVDEVEVLHSQSRMILILAVRSGPNLGLVACVHVENSSIASAGQGDQSASVDHDVRIGVVTDLGCFVHHDRDGIGPAVEDDGSALCHGSNKRR